MLFLLTEYCDMNCPHCMIDATTERKHASLETVDKFIRFAKTLNSRRIAISGGEATQHPYFLKYFERILKDFKEADIVLMSNGSFLDNLDSFKILQDKYFFYTQISSIKGLYKDHEKTLELFNKYASSLQRTYLVTELHFLEEHLGRAKNNDLSEYRTGNKRNAPSCFNLFSAARSLSSFKDIIYYMETNLQYGHCKPMIDSTGNIYVSESKNCVKLGTLNDSLDMLFYNLKRNKPCEKCKNKVPSQFKTLLGW